MVRPWSGRPGFWLLNDAAGELLTPDLERRLGRAPLAVWLYLLDLRGHAACWRKVAYAQLEDKVGLTPKQVKAAMRRLREVGLVLCNRQRVRSGGAAPADQVGDGRTWTSTLEVLTSGILDGPDTWLPAGSAVLLRARNTHGGPRRRQEQEGPMPPGPGEKDADLAEQEGPPKRRVRTREVPLSPPTKERLTAARGPGPETARGAESSLGVERGEPVGRRASIRLMAEKPLTPETASAMHADDPGTVSTRPDVVRPGDSPEFRLRFLVREYNRACRLVYGEDGKCFLPAKLPERSNLGAKLLQCAAALEEHDVPPSLWAEWALRRAREQQEAAGKPVRKPYVLAVFAASYVVKCRGWFRRTSPQQASRRSLATREHQEQVYRKREAMRLARGVSHLWGFPEWYCVLREQEVAALPEAADPRYFFPDLSGRRVRK